MRRKSERTATKKKPEKSPEKKIEKVKRTRTRRRKQSTSSDNESADEAPPVQEKQVDTKVEENVQQTPTKEDSPEDAADQVWRVKASEGSGDIGEIKKLKICLTRPPSTPERVDRSPRSKRKHSRATSSSDTPSNEGVDEKRKSKHRSKKSSRESKDDCDKNHDSQEELELERMDVDKSSDQIPQSTKPSEEPISDDTPMSTTNDEAKSQDTGPDDNNVNKHGEKSNDDSIENSKTPDADTTVASPKVETTVVSSEIDANDNTTNECNEPPRRDSTEDKSEILELHADDNRCESSDTEIGKSKSVICENEIIEAQKNEAEVKVSKKTDETDSVCKEAQSNNKSDNSDVVESTEQIKPAVRKLSFDSTKTSEEQKENSEKCNEIVDSSQSAAGETVCTPIVITRKRRWGSRPKLSTQKSLTISTDVLKDIIPDVKPVEFEEVIEERKSKREVTEKIEKPILPKIVIDNSQNVEQNRRNQEKEEDAKNKDLNISSNRKISIVNDNDSIVARPPSPPRHKQSCILYITNLVRPFTLAQLKNLLQRTGRIVEDGFWIDRIKSKCFVKYATEEQAVETRHALHGVTWPVSNPKTLQVDFSNDESFEKAKLNEETEKSQTTTTPGTVEDWLREQDMKRERGELDKPYERKAVMREWDMGKMDKDKDKVDRTNIRRLDERSLEKRRHRSVERSPEPARKFKKKEEEAPAKLLDDLFRKTKASPCIYWLPLSSETIAIKEEQRRQHMAENERRLQELRRTHRRH